MDERPCKNCFRPTSILRKGICHRCYEYRRRKGVMRPPSPVKKTLCLPGQGPDYCNNPVTTSRRIQVSWPASRTVNLPLCEACAKLFDDEESQQRNNSVPGTYHRPGFTGYAKW